jgi:hypothetical protein
MGKILTEEQREHLGREAYGLRAAGVEWSAIITELAANGSTLAYLAKAFARLHNRPWPIKGRHHNASPIVRKTRAFTAAQQSEVDAHRCQRIGCGHPREHHFPEGCVRCRCKEFQGQKAWPTIGAPK